MSRRQEQFEKIKCSPFNVTFDEIRRLLEAEAFFLERITGSHHVFRKGDVIFVLPVHNNRVKAVYVK